ncbi:hypothetical protein [Nonomuraea sp. NPDC002799]
MPNNEPFCPVGPHTDGIEVSDWEREREAPFTMANSQGAWPARRSITVQASVHVMCRRHGFDDRVDVGPDYRPPGYRA